MPLDVIMPALGMAQETGQVVAWHKQPGDLVAKGDVLFEVETDKATMEVEAQANGYLTDVSAAEGEDIPVGRVIAKISDSAKSVAPKDVGDTARAPIEDLPKGKEVIMPTLGMAQDTGLLVMWHKAAGDAVGADDVLFEVETDKSTVEVNAGVDGYIAALLAEEGQEVPVGHTIAIISAEVPANPITRKATAAPTTGRGTAAQVKATPAVKAPAPSKPALAKASHSPRTDGRILASPKVRRLAREQGLDLGHLVKAGYPQPFHVKDLETLKSMPSATSVTQTTQTSSRITAEISSEGFTAFAAWAADNSKLKDPSALLAGLCSASMGKDMVISVESFGATKTYAASAQLSSTSASDQARQIHLRDLRFTPITTVQVGAADVPILTLTRHGVGLAITLEYAPSQLDATDAITLISKFAGRMEQPLRHLL
jgi:pyruvate dehydrogenase E2 component (dihydrolipoamide acetyltransferase)/2-oxoglutarate dehydrogenase E2 component (dihydrolipoamide succinyltransferase)